MTQSQVITNKELQKILKGTLWAYTMTDKQFSGRLSRHLALLRKQDLIEKMPNQRKYLITDISCKITTALNAALAASAEEWLELAA